MDTQHARPAPSPRRIHDETRAPCLGPGLQVLHRAGIIRQVVA